MQYSLTMRSGTCLEAATNIGAWLQFAARRMLLIQT